MNKKKELKIIRLNSKSLSLERRAYAVLKKSKFEGYGWNSQGRHCKIKQLYNLSRTKELKLLFGEEISDDLETYRMQIEERSKPYKEKGIEAVLQQN